MRHLTTHGPLSLYFADLPAQCGDAMKPVATGILAILLSLGYGVAAQDGSPQRQPPLAEVYDLVRTNLHGLSETELNRLAVEGLLNALGPRVALLSGRSNASPTAPLLQQVSVLEDNVAYVRVGTVAPDLAAALARAHTELNRTSKVVGIVLDLRYAGGDDYAAASAAAALFLRSKRPLLDAGSGAEAVAPPDNPITLPVAVLINRQTRGAAEALAGALRAAAAGLLLGAPTAGAAAVSREFPLSTGQRLRIATTPVKLADGTPLAPAGVTPDIHVQVNPADEAAFFAEPYGPRAKPAPSTSGRETASVSDPASTNRIARRARTSEADLVRARRQGGSDNDTTAPESDEPVRPVLQDPVLARAVDLIKGLAVVRPVKTPEAR